LNQPPFPTRNPDVVASRLRDGGLVILHLESGEYHELNRVGAAIWDLIDGTLSPPEIARELRPDLEGAPDDLESVVATYLSELRERDLVV